MIGRFLIDTQNAYDKVTAPTSLQQTLPGCGAGVLSLIHILGDLSKLIYAAKKIYDSHRDDLERERTDEEFMAMYEQYEAFDELEDEFLEKEEEYTALVAGYVDEHLELFAKIV